MKVVRKKGIQEIKITHNRVLFWIIIFLLVCLIALLIVIRNIGDKSKIGDNNTGLGNTGLANPASVYCIEHGGNLSIKTDSNGGQYGACIFLNGSECEEWAYYRGECK